MLREQRVCSYSRLCDGKGLHPTQAQHVLHAACFPRADRDMNVTHLFRLMTLDGLVTDACCSTTGSRHMASCQ